MSGHVTETDLALYVSGDLTLWDIARVRLHTAGCDRCKRLAEGYHRDRTRMRQIVAEMPEGLDWERLSSEMTANIRVGLAAGECVAPRRHKTAGLGWRPAAAMAGLAVLLATGWWLNMPPSTTQALGRAFSAIAHGRGSSIELVMEPRGAFVQANATGAELRGDGGTLGFLQGGAAPVAVSVSSQGSASASYVDGDTGRMTITSVYAQ
jgi:anti-sigma factor RsiW